MTKIVKTNNGSFKPQYVFELFRETEIHPLTHRSTHFIDVRIYKPREDAEYMKTPKATPATPEILILGVPFEVRAATPNLGSISFFSARQAEQIIARPDDFSAAADRTGSKDSAVRFLVEEGIDLDHLRSVCKHLAPALLNEEITIENAPSEARPSLKFPQRFVPQPAGFSTWLSAVSMDDRIALRRLQEEARKRSWYLGNAYNEIAQDSLAS